MQFLQFDDYNKVIKITTSIEFILCLEHSAQCFTYVTNLILPESYGTGTLVSILTSLTDEETESPLNQQHSQYNAPGVFKGGTGIPLWPKTSVKICYTHSYYG